MLACMPPVLAQTQNKYKLPVSTGTSSQSIYRYRGMVVHAHSLNNLSSRARGSAIIEPNLSVLILANLLLESSSIENDVINKYAMNE